MKPNLDHIDLGSIEWRKSSFSNGSGGMCVEVGRLEHGGALLRDSKQPDGPVLAFSANEWDKHLRGVWAGEHGQPDGFAVIVYELDDDDKAAHVVSHLFEDREEAEDWAAEFSQHCAVVPFKPARPTDEPDDLIGVPDGSSRPAQDESIGETA